MPKTDKGHKKADDELKKLEEKLAREYSQAALGVTKKLETYFAEFEKKSEKMLKQVANGKMTPDEYATWRRNQMLTGERWKSMQEELTKDLVNADKIAAGMINDSLPNAYAENMNFGTYEIETGTQVNTSFTLYDRDTVKNLMKDDPKIIPQARVDIPEDRRWNRQKLTSAITQGILQGEGIPKISERISSAVGGAFYTIDDIRKRDQKTAEQIAQELERRNRSAAIRNARTYTTAAENKGRVDAIERANDMGIPADMEWIATLDDRTRIEHRHLDGQVRPVGEPFETDGYKILYPGDPSAEPEMIYNCRCTLVSRVRGRIYNDERNDSKLDGMSYEQWKNGKEPEPKENNVTMEPATKELTTENQEAYEKVKAYAEANGLVMRDVEEMDRPLTTEEIVAKIAGGDMTKGSCASLSLAYISNAIGLDVTDYQGGKSRDCFSRLMNYQKMVEISNANVTIHGVKKEAKETAELLKGLPKDKEFVLVAGKHASIVRNSSEEGLQFLELQHPKLCGWTPFEQDIEFFGLKEHMTIEDTLKERFGCRKGEKRVAGEAIETRVLIAEVGSFQPTKEFKEMMGYINTDPDKQQKGAKGGVR